MLEITELLFDSSPRWLTLTPDQSDTAPAIFLTPLDWTQYELCRRAAMLPKSEAVNPRQFFAQAILLTTPTRWRGFVKNGVEPPFDRELLFSFLFSNAALGTAFDTALKTWALNEKTQRDDAAKNSDAGRATPDTAPGNKKKDRNAA